MQRRRRVVSVCEVRKPRWYRAGNESFEFHALTALRRAPLGSHVWKARTKIKQQLLQSGLHGLLQRPPFVDGTSTAVYTPRRVTICGPFLRAVLRDFVKRAFA